MLDVDTNPMQSSLSFSSRGPTSAANLLPGPPSTAPSRHFWHSRGALGAIVARQCPKVPPLSPKLVSRVPPDRHVELSLGSLTSENIKNTIEYHRFHDATKMVFWTLLGPLFAVRGRKRAPKAPKGGTKEPKELHLGQLFHTKSTTNRHWMSQVALGTANAPKMHQKVTPGTQISPIWDIF